MDKKTQVYIYAFLSRLFEKEIDLKLLSDLKKSEEITQMISPDLHKWFDLKSDDELLEELSIDFTSLFVMNHTQPIETAILDDKDEVLVGLQNPVMQFYFDHGYELHLDKTHIQTPDHISLEFGFMQNLVQKERYDIAAMFLKKHILQWVPSYLLSMKESARSLFYEELCDFTIEFILASYETLMSEATEVES